MAEIDAPDDEVWFQGLRWVEAVNMQAARVEEAVAEQHAANTDAAIRSALNNAEDETELRAARRAAFDADPEIGSRPVRVPSWSLGMQVSTEMDFLIVAVRNLLRAQDRLPAPAATAMADQEILELLRKTAEHYDRRDGRSQQQLAQKYPRVMPDAFHFTSKEIWIGGGPSGIPLSRIREWSARVSSALREALNNIGVPTPDDFDASLVDGDDDQDWPAERLHFGWWLPFVHESEWPEGEPPEGLTEVLAERFQNLRGRDGND